MKFYAFGLIITTALCAMTSAWAAAPDSEFDEGGAPYIPAGCRPVPRIYTPVSTNNPLHHVRQKPQEDAQKDSLSLAITQENEQDDASERRPASRPIPIPSPKARRRSP